MTQHEGRSFFIGAIIGGAIGAMATLLFGTEKGKEIKTKFIRKYKQFSHHFEDDLKHTLQRAKKRILGKKKRTR